MWIHNFKDWKLWLIFQRFNYIEIISVHLTLTVFVLGFLFSAPNPHNFTTNRFKACFSFVVNDIFRFPSLKKLSHLINSNKTLIVKNCFLENENEFLWSFFKNTKNTLYPKILFFCTKYLHVEFFHGLHDGKDWWKYFKIGRYV